MPAPSSPRIAPGPNIWTRPASEMAATVLPFRSEVVQFGLLLTEHYRWWVLVAVASAANMLGSAVNWLLERLLAKFEDRPRFPVKRETIAPAETWHHRYGRWPLLLSWLPFIGDPLTVLASVLREPFSVFIGLVALAKTARSFAVAAITFGWF